MSTDSLRTEIEQRRNGARSKLQYGIAETGNSWLGGKVAAYDEILALLDTEGDGESP